MFRDGMKPEDMGDEDEDLLLPSFNNVQLHSQTLHKEKSKENESQLNDSGLIRSPDKDED